MQLPGMKTIATVVAGLTLALVVVLNSFTIVQEGDVKVQSLFGKVDQTEVLKAGFHVVNPFKSFDRYSIRNDKYEIDGLNVPTQDRFNSTANVTVLYSIDGSLAPLIKTKYGTSDQFIDKTMRQQLRSIIRDEGRKLKDSRSLAVSSNVTAMQDSTRQRLVEAIGGSGITVTEVLVQDIEFDSRIAQQILATQTRIQAEKARKSVERTSLTNANIAKNEALGAGNRKREEADATAYSVGVKAKADKEAAIARATGEAEAITLVAAAQSEANIKLSRTLTKDILRKQELDNQLVLYKQSKGAVPASVTILNSGDLQTLGFPFAVK